MLNANVEISRVKPGLVGAADGGQAEGRAAEARAARPAAALPCLFVTTASKEESRLLPGPRKKQADALTENIKWMVKTFGREGIGFLTLTLGDRDVGGRFRNLRDRKEAQRRFHSLLTNVIARRYPCGVIITERHRNGGLHFHLGVACPEDIRGNIDFDACFPKKDGRGKPVHPPDYSTANDAIKREWAFWRRIAKLYGFGRHQLQPMRENGEALGRYLGAYLGKDWEHRLPEDENVGQFEVTIGLPYVYDSFTPVMITPSGNLSFSLGAGRRIIFPTGPPGQYTVFMQYEGSFSSTPAVFTDLLAGLGEFQLTSDSPSVVLTGAVVPTPEPSVSALLLCGLVIWRRLRLSESHRRL